MGQGDTLINAVIGAVVTVVLSFLGISAVIGGGVAGYLQEEGRGRGARVGAISGALATVPFVLLLFLIFGVLLGAVGVPGLPELIILLLIVGIAFAVNVGLGALGGYLGAYLYEDQNR